MLINQLGLSSNENSGGNGRGLRLLLNHYVEDIKRLDQDHLQVLARDTLTGEARYFQAGKLVLAGGAIESPKLLARSTLGHDLPQHVRSLVGQGLTDHPTTNEILTTATHMSDVAIPKNANAKIVFYSRGKRDNAGQIIYPFNVEMNVNHEYWHLRENDPSSPDTPIATTGDSIIDIKFSFGNCLDSGNAIREAPPFGYVPYKEWFGGPILPESVVDEDLRVKSAANLYVCDMSVMPFASAANPVRTLTALALPSRLPALAGWQKSDTEVFAVLND